jgi:hypothetical protein
MKKSKSNSKQQKRSQTSLFRDDLARILDEVNAWGFLDDVKDSDPKTLNCFGPKDFRGFSPSAWVGVVLWAKARNYYSYRHLYLLGVWVYRVDETAQVVVGQKTLTYKLPFFDPEAFQFMIKKRFDLHYEGDASPPAEGERLYSTTYDAEQRITIRQEIQRALKAWVVEHSGGK